ncbi:Phosphorylated carbohydrates phosphatase [Sedimentisphaera cyanobacteriorum]|uniref:Phosphorylated carbohydrates phosphatase n=1 Tax=Sedimentisphaera cyanobacteriorum TaxID=1940790 RepID=A0A1Q2HSU9_9BACT|nr:HAD family phosphatase [Sedimentisphaera cyanobacteriorum]AQQ10354.1 Phosphorylated carbohydrates phosphatase [Sedimentisphaera cyanobacteriorum]
MKFKAVIFDFDGVIADTELLHYMAFCRVLEKEAGKIEKDTYWDKYLGFTDKEALEAMSRDYGFELTEEKLGWLIDEKAAVFDELASTESCILDGFSRLTSSLSRAGIKMAICSGALFSDIEGIFSAEAERSGQNFFKYFDAVVTADDVNRGKPHPEGYLKAVEKLGRTASGVLSPAECTVIEDSHWGLEAGAAAGAKTVGVTGTYSRSELEAKADMVVDSLAELSAEKISGIFQ